MIKSEHYKESLAYIENQWPDVKFHFCGSEQVNFGFPNEFISINDVIFEHDQFYWDSYFIILGLMKSNKVTLERASDITELFQRFEIKDDINSGASQIPFMTSIAIDVFEHTKYLLWLKQAINEETQLSVHEIEEKLLKKHMAYTGLLSHCNDHLNYLAVDLNSCLFKYEKELSELYHLINVQDKYIYYKQQAEDRKKAINTLMWNETKSFFFDYDKRIKKQSEYLSVAGFYPLWAELASAEQAKQIQKYILPIIEKNIDAPHSISEGIHTCKSSYQRWIIIKSLLNYGFKEDAERIAKTWLDMKHKSFLENRKSSKTTHAGELSNQHDFEWTHIIFKRLIHEFENN
jgi:neutral trehalase